MTSTSSPLDAERLRRELGEKRRIGHRIEIHEELDSTNSEASRRIQTQSIDELDGLVLIAEAQTQGRGRRGDPWHSPPRSGLWITALFRTTLFGESLALLSVVAGVAMVRAVDCLGGPKLSLKWPNDLYLGDRKAGGILLEMRTGIEGDPLAILGIGLNTHLDQASFPAELRENATSLKAQAKESGGRAPTRHHLLVEILNELEIALQEAESSNLDGLASVWKNRSILRDRRITVQSQGATLIGRVVDLPLPPSLVLIDDSGHYHEIRGEWAHIVRIEEKNF